MFISQTNTAEKVPAPAITFILREPWSKGEDSWVNMHFLKNGS